MNPNDKQSKSNNQDEATLNAVRRQIDRIYDSTVPDNRPVKKDSGNATQKRPVHPHPSQIEAEKWRQYHSSWQNYYQKYYEQYYVKEVRKALERQPNSNSRIKDPSYYVERAANSTSNSGGSHGGNGEHTSSSDGEYYTDKQKAAIENLRNNIRDKAKTSAKKARKSRHFIPIASAVVVVAVFAILQYNQIMIANVKAYIAPSNIEPQNIIVDPSVDVPVGPETKMIIPKINVDAPIIMDVGPSGAEQMKAMSKGLAHVKYPGATSVPGQVGNAVFSGHSSSDWFSKGNYKFVFVQLEKLTKGDIIYINYDSKRYAYKVYEKKEVEPTDIQALDYKGHDPIITLITCTPIGTAKHRLLVFAKQISPSPSEAKKAPDSDIESNQSQLTGTPPTLLERIFGS